MKGIAKVRTTVSGRKNMVSLAISNYGGLGIALTKIRRFMYESDIPWDGANSQVQIAINTVKTLYDNGAITLFSNDRALDELGYLEDVVESRNTDSVIHSVGEMFTIYNDMREDVAVYCLNPKAVAVKRGVTE